MKLHPYPFLASDFISKFSTDELLFSASLEPARLRGKERVLQAIEGNIKRNPRLDDRIELLSHIFAKLIVSCIDDHYLMRRYAIAEAKFMRDFLMKESLPFLQNVSTELGIGANLEGENFKLHFSDYVELAPQLGPKWKLVNRSIRRGWILITKEELTRLLQEKIRKRIQSSLPVKIDSSICKVVKKYSEDIKVRIKREGMFSLPSTRFFPPCMLNLLSRVGSGLTHSARFALTSFLLNIGMERDEVIKIFSQTPDFDAEQTRYQVEHIAGRGGSGTKYVAPSCATMLTYQNCSKPDELCRKIRHPVSYYWRKRKEES